MSDLLPDGLKTISSPNLVPLLQEELDFDLPDFVISS